MKCRHCEQTEPEDRRQLCRGCYRDSEIRALYPKLKFGVWSPTAGFGSSIRLSAEPTEALPGTEDKIAVMAGRAMRGEAVCHPRDARRSDQPVERTIESLTSEEDDECTSS